MISAKPRAPQSTVSFCRTLILPLALLTFMVAALFSSPAADAQSEATANVGNVNGVIRSDMNKRGWLTAAP